MIAGKLSKTSYTPCRRPLDGLAGPWRPCSAMRGSVAPGGATSGLDWMHRSRGQFDLVAA